MDLSKIRMDEWMVIVFLVLWVLTLWTFGSSPIFEALSAEEPTQILGVPANILFVVIITAVFALLPWIFTRHIDFDAKRMPETKRKFKWTDEEDE